MCEAPRPGYGLKCMTPDLKNSYPLSVSFSEMINICFYCLNIILFCFAPFIYGKLWLIIQRLAIKYSELSIMSILILLHAFLMLFFHLSL